MNKRLKITVGCLIAILAYVGAYGCFRLGGELVHFQNRSLPQGHEVKAPADQWTDILPGMAADSESFSLKAWTAWEKRKPKVLNGVFWPLRTIESTCWKYAQ